MTAAIQDAVQIQIEREVRMADDGRARALGADQKAAKEGDQTRMEKLTLAPLLPIVRDFLVALHASYTGGRPPVWYRLLARLDMDEVAAAALRGAFSAALRSLDRAKAMREIGRALEIVYVHTGLLAQDQRAQQKRRIRALVKGRDTPRGRRGAILRAATDHEGWDDMLLVNAAEPLVNAVLSTGLFMWQAVGFDDTRRDLFVLSEDGRKLAQEVEDLGKLARPILRPMIVKPQSWEDTKTGAYITDAVRRTVPLVRTWELGGRRLLERGVADGSLRPVLDAVTTIQSVPLRVNRDVLALRDWAFAERLTVGGTLPLQTPVEMPEIPADIDQLPAPQQRRIWANRARAARVNKGIGPNLVAFRATSAEAGELADQGPFYLPHSCDFRGRVYPVPSFSHHATDATKALFEFSRGQALGEHGLAWLYIHTANCGDFGKVSKRPYADRVQWAMDNLEMIERVAEDPRTNREWMEADAPFSFYAACVDVIRALDSGDPANYVSHLPVALDGSNSGVQHYSAAMRAEEGAYVNLTPTPAPMDLYAKVAERVSALCARIVKMNGERPDPLGDLNRVLADLEARKARIEEAKKLTGELRLDATEKGIISNLEKRRDRLVAELWHRHGITRSTVKRSVMTFGYSSVAFGFAQQIREDFMEPLALEVMKGERESHPFGDDEGRAAAGLLGRLVYRCVVRALPRVAAAMKWLQGVAAILAHEAKGVLMVTPTGFPMLMKTTEMTTKRVELHLLDRSVPVMEATGKDAVIGDSVLKRVVCNMRFPGDKVVMKHKQQSGVAPNVIHACDASHLMLTVLAMRERGIRDMLLIHDSFATHAANVGEMSWVLREQMVALYATWNPLEDIAARARKVLSTEGVVKLDKLTLPALGTLPLDGVLEAEYAFS